MPASNPIFTSVGLIRRGRRRNDPLPHGLFRRIRGIFQASAFVAQMPNIAIAAVNILRRLLDWHVVFAGISNCFLA